MLTYIAFIFLMVFSTCKREEPLPPVSPPETPPSIHPDLRLICHLDSSLSESSGLLFFNNVIFTHNDRGWPNEIYTLDTLNGKPVHTLILNNAQSVDYEDLAQSPQHIFIGDFGNNKGGRDTLDIYRINKYALVFETPILHLNTQKISFIYPDKKTDPKNKKHNFDCEAFVFLNDSLFIFTKNRGDERTNLYVIPSVNGHHTAQFVTSFDSKGMVTGADILEDGSKLALIGYTKSDDVFVWIFENFDGSTFFNGQNTYINLGLFNQVGQAEGIAFKDANSLFISTEKTKDEPAKLYSLQLK